MGYNDPGKPASWTLFDNDQLWQLLKQVLWKHVFTVQVVREDMGGRGKLKQEKLCHRAAQQ